jgi:hypothetical protein
MIFPNRKWLTHTAIFEGHVDGFHSISVVDHLGRLVREGTKRNKNALWYSHRALKNKSGIDLLSHTVTRIVPSAQRGLTSLFGMGRGVTPAI